MLGVNAGEWMLSLAHNRKWEKQQDQTLSVACGGCPCSEVWRIWLRSLQVSVGLSTCGLQGVEIAPQGREKKRSLRFYAGTEM